MCRVRQRIWSRPFSEASQRSRTNVHNATNNLVKLTILTDTCFLLKAHMLTHTGEKKHKCAQCEKAFGHGHVLKRHMLTHTGEKSHKCAQCNNQFGKADHLNRHMLLHCEKIHKCIECNKSFNRTTTVHRGERNPIM